MKVFQQNRYHASLAKKKIVPYKFGSVKTVSLHSSFFAKYYLCLSDVSSEVTGLYFEKSNIYEDILPRSDLNPTNGRFSCIECAKLCRSDVLSDFLPQTRKDDFLSLQLSINGIHRNIPGIGD